MTEQHDPDDAAPDLLTFLASSVHDMKNSVSMLIGGMQRILSSADRASLPAYDDLTQMTYEAGRINSNLVQLLTLYKLGSQLYPFDPKEIPVAEFLSQVSGQAGTLLKSRAVQLDVEAPADLYWYFDEDLIASVIGNAFSNAVRYTKDRVRLTAAVVDNRLELRIDDNGRGYTDEMLEQARRPVGKIDFQSASTGLGLYFSAVIAKLHRNRANHGEILLENRGSLGGGCFVLRLP